jgi:uncharacterized radical SAM protein YgiQ
MFLPTCLEEAKERGWPELDIVIVSGDAYCDHPSYGASVIGRYLERDGFKVGIIAQPDWRSTKDFLALGKPRLFFGVTAGNTDSLIANYTANKKPRTTDDYSPAGKAGLRPDRAVIVYANRIREAFGDVRIVLGGVEASLRRLAHYDYWDDAVRRSVLIDAKADVLVYGMGELAIGEIARRARDGEDIRHMRGIPGTVAVCKDLAALKKCAIIPSYEEVSTDKHKFNEALRDIYRAQNPVKNQILAQKHGDRFAVHFPPSRALSTRELDEIYELPYAYDCHPRYRALGGIPGFETVRFSIVSHRGCAGACHFCSLYAHQGRIVQSRSRESLVREARNMSQRKDFKGTITDIGGPTANLYAARCLKWRDKGFCEDRQCLTPVKCKDFALGYEESIALYRAIRALPGIKHVFIASGFRYDLLGEGYANAYMRELCAFHIGGQMKVAPEHSVNHVLRFMNKSSRGMYEKFVDAFNRTNAALKKNQYLVNYFITAHPGTTLQDAYALSRFLKEKKIRPEQIQDFIPLPMTVSGAMYYTGMHPFTGETLYVAKDHQERKKQRTLARYDTPSAHAAGKPFRRTHKKHGAKRRTP